MRRTFRVENVTCGGCANTIKVSLEDEFAGIEVNLDSDPKEVSLDIKDEESLQKFKQQMQELGYPVIEEISKA